MTPFITLRSARVKDFVGWRRVFGVQICSLQQSKKLASPGDAESRRFCRSLRDSASLRETFRKSLPNEDAAALRPPRFAGNPARRPAQLVASAAMGSRISKQAPP